MDGKGFSIEVTSNYEAWWRYNVVLMCGCFDAEGQRIGFASAASHVADVGTNLNQCPPDIDPHRKARLETIPCNRIRLYLYIIPHTLPANNEIEANKPFEIKIRTAYGREHLQEKRREINQWSGASIEMWIDQPE